MIDKRLNPQAEEPRSEPEVIPPDDAHVTRRMRIDTETGRIYVAKVSPLGTILVVLIVGLFSAVMLVLLLGALLIWLPAVVLLATAAIVAGLFVPIFNVRLEDRDGLRELRCTADLSRLCSTDHQPRYRHACLHAQFGVGDLRLQAKGREQPRDVGLGMTVPAV
jgi:hypothetical protein